MEHFLLAIGMSLLSSCSNLPAAIENPPLYDLSYSQATQQINHFTGAPVRWGGVIITVENEQNFSLMQVLNYPLSDWGRPQLDKPYNGRFVVKTPEFLDPVIYKSDSEITIAGTLKGDIKRSIGNKTLQIPLIEATTIYLWPSYDASDYYGYRPYGYSGFGLHYPYYGYYGFYPYYWDGFYYPYW